MNSARKPHTNRPDLRPTGSRLKLASAVVGVLVIAIGAWLTQTPPLTRPVSSALSARNILLVTIDTLRADALGAYGNKTAATPWLDRLAAGGLRFDDARSHNVVTLPSHANIMTGRLPVDHGVRDNAGFRLAPSEDTLARRLHAAGFRTGAFISAFPLDSRFGLAAGFDVYDDAFLDAAPRPALLEQERSGPDTVSAASRWLHERHASERWFCWVHLYEPHFPYSPPQPFAARFAAAPYAGEVAAVDAALGALLQPFLDNGGSSDTLIVLTSDHGESLGEHDEATHGIFGYDATLKVPLLIYFPRLLQPSVVTAQARHVDIFPTILEAVGIALPANLRGRSLLDLPRHGPADTSSTYFEALSGPLNRGWAPLTGVVADGMKYIDLPIPELHDLRADPRERHNLAGSRPQRVAELRTLLQSYGRGETARGREPSDVTDRLRSLGYVTSAAGVLEKRYTEADDPKRQIAGEARLQDVLAAYLSGNLREALARARALVRERPGMRIALLQLAHLERDDGNLAGAIEALRRALRLNVEDSETASLLGAYLTAANRAPEAIAVMERYARAPDADTQILAALALAEARTGRFADAVETLERARAQDPSNALVMVDIGTVELMAGRRTPARTAFETALQLNPAIARAHSSLAAMAAEDGRPEDSMSHWRAAVAADAAEYEKVLAIGIGLSRAGRAAEARRYIQFFAETAPAARFSADIERARLWLSTRTGR